MNKLNIYLKFFFKFKNNLYIWISIYLLNSISTIAACKRFWRLSSDSVFLSLKRFS